LIRFSLIEVPVCKNQVIKAVAYLFGIFAYAHFDTSVFRLCLLIKHFSFIMMHLSFDCIVSQIFFFYYGASVFRLQLLIDFIYEV
jgi:hypothetical protein